MTLTKRRDGSAWRVVVDGLDAPIWIAKGEKPRYREPQEWHVLGVDDDFLFTAHGLDQAMSRLSAIVTALTPSTHDR